MFSLFSNTKESRSIILDIQSGLVRGALVLHTTYKNRHRPARILSVITRSYSEKNLIITAESLMGKNLELIADVVQSLAKESGRHRISSIDYMLSSPWIFSKLKTLKIEYEKETLVNSKTLEGVIHEELKDANALNTSKDLVPIEQKIFEIRLNGYPTTMFEGKKTHKFEVSLSTSFSSSDFLNKVNEVVQKCIHIKKHTLHSALLMQYTALREILKHKNEFFYIHVHNELTDIIIVKDGLCKHIASFPFGVSTLLREIALKTSESIETSDSLLSLLQGNKLNEEEKENIKRITSELVHQWYTSCVKSFEGIFDTTSIPRTVYLSAHSHFELFKDTLINQNDFNFNIVAYDSIDIGDDVVFENSSTQSNMMKIYTFALHNMIY